MTDYEKLLEEVERLHDGHTWRVERNVDIRTNDARSTFVANCSDEENPQPRHIAQARRIVAEHNALPRLAAALREVMAERDGALAWSNDESAQPESDAIRAAHPTRTGKHETYAEAMRLVGARRSKGALVDLVNWLMAERDAALRVHNEAEQTLDMERTVRAEAERDLVSARAALHERGSAPLAEHEDMARWKRLPVWAQQELEQWRRNEAHQRGLAEAALADVEAMRALLLDADEALTGSVAAYPESDVCRRIRSALDARATPSGGKGRTK